MARGKYLTAPLPSQKMPGGVPYIVGNEAAERFSFYGMKGILVAYMTTRLLAADGSLATMTGEQAKFWYHSFGWAVYFFPLLGAIVSDGLLGKYRTIVSLSLVYCLGHLALALDETRLGLFVGLALIAVGAGGIKPCVSAHVGDQFGASNQHLLEKVFGWFYFSINFGAFLSSLLTPWLLDTPGFGPKWAFGVPGVLMLLATLVFWAGRHKFVHVPPAGRHFVREALGGEGLRAVFKLSILYLFVAVFWALYDQGGSAWVLQAGKMDRWIGLAWLDRLGWEQVWLPWSGWYRLPTRVEVLPAQVQAVNPLLIMLFMPLFAYVIYPALNQVFRLTPLRKIGLGFFLTVVAFAVPAWVEQLIQEGRTPHIAWQLAAYVILTAAEVMVSITVLEFSYTQAPRRMKSFIMSLSLLSVSAGNAFTAAVNYFIQNADGSSKLAGASYYWFFTALMFMAACLFILVARSYPERTYIQDGG